MAQNPNLRLAQQQQANLARAYASSYSRPSRILATSPSAPQKSASELMEERLLPLKERQQKMQMEEYFGGIGLRSQQAQLASEQTRQSLGLLPLQTQQQRQQIGEYLGGAGLRSQQQALAGTQTRLGQAQADVSLAGIGDITAAGRRAYTLGREEEELSRLRMASEGRRLQGQMSLQPQMQTIQGGIMNRMASRLGVSLPAMGGAYSSGTGYTPSWMQSLQSPQFPRYS